MTDKRQRVLVTGGLGFIGSHVVDLLLTRGYHVINVDKMTYAIREDTDFQTRPNYEFIKEDICDLRSLPPDITHIINLAAESHVDNSIIDSAPFFRSNVEGVYNLLELVRKTPEDKRPVFIQISTDEVYGDILAGSFREDARLTPSSPYSATKAAADQLVLGWARTYGLKVRIHRASNNYGYGQRPEKLIPRAMKLARKGIKMPVHGDGSARREWTFVGDNASAILLIMEKGIDGEIYNVSAREELANLEVVSKVMRVMGKPEDFYELVPDRPGQDRRYAIGTEKIHSLGWKPTMTLDQYLPLCKVKNEERSSSLAPGKKDRLLRLFGLK